MTPPDDAGLVERLREDYAINLDWPVSAKIVVIDMNHERYQAADRIEALKGEVERLNKAASDVLGLSWHHTLEAVPDATQHLQALVNLGAARSLSRPVEEE